MERMKVKARGGSYEVVMGGGAWRAFRELESKDFSRTFILTERGIWKRWGKIFLRASGLKEPRVIFIRPGERTKVLGTAEQVALQLLRARADRKSLLVAFGGGVVGDLGGFVASIYMRGIDYVQAPTTIVAQVDSSIGGKTGVDAGPMKNLLGTFYPPGLVLAEPRVLESLRPRAFRSGLYEMIKHGILAGSPLFEELEAKIPRASPEQAKSLEGILVQAARVKVEIVSHDERESGMRRLLNLGHTFGHALEEATGYRRLLHGEAVGWGLLAAVKLGERLGLLGSNEAERMARLVRSTGPLPSIRDLRADEVIALTASDKKTVAGRVRWIVPQGIGKVTIVADVPPADAAEALEDVQRARWGG